MKGLATRGSALASSVAIIAALAACSGTPPNTPEPPYVPPQGVTETEIILGTHQPITGTASGGYSKIAPATKAYFDYVNANGGVHGRKITYKIVDDANDPATTQTVVRQLVQQDKVFAVLNGLGTATHTGVQDLLKESGVPDLFVGSGATAWNSPAKYPGTFAFQPDYTTEGKIIGNYIKNTATLAGKKVCHFGQDDDFGQDALAGLERGLGAPVASKQTYNPTNTNVGPQITSLAGAGCEVVVLATSPGFTALAVGTASRLGTFKPQWISSSVGGDYTAVATVLGAARPLLEGFMSSGYLPAPQATSDPWIELFQRINDDYNDGETFDSNVLYGMSVGYLTVQTLLKAGRNITVDGLIETLEEGGFKGPGIVPFAYSTTSHAGYTGIRMSRVASGVQDYFGPAYVTDAGAAPVTEYTDAPTVPPANGIPTD
jgi:ABC-type branched-subunit amino acid transport system substrate-binding protein